MRGIKSQKSPKKQKSGQIFSIDAVIGAFIVGVLIIATVFSIVRTTETETTQISKVGYDIVTVLDYEGKLASLNATEIAIRLNSTLPQNYDMKLLLEGNFDSIEVGNQPLQRFVASGQRTFVNATAGTRGIATFLIWVK